VPGPGAHAADARGLAELTRLLIGLAHRSLTIDLPLSDVRALFTLEEWAPCTVGHLADQLQQPASTVTRLCDRLVNKGLLARRTRPANRREVELSLTAAGARLVQQVTAARTAELERVLSRLPAARRAQLADVLPDLLAAAHEQLPSAQPAWAL
jgi:DNA-binding MarR family transcriptional regulator